MSMDYQLIFKIAADSKEMLPKAKSGINRNLEVLAGLAEVLNTDPAGEITTGIATTQDEEGKISLHMARKTPVPQNMRAPQSMEWVFPAKGTPRTWVDSYAVFASNIKDFEFAPIKPVNCHQSDLNGGIIWMLAQAKLFTSPGEQERIGNAIPAALEGSSMRQAVKNYIEIVSDQFFPQSKVGIAELEKAVNELQAVLDHHNISHVKANVEQSPWGTQIMLQRIDKEELFWRDTEIHAWSIHEPRDNKGLYGYGDCRRQAQYRHQDLGFPIGPKATISTILAEVVVSLQKNFLKPEQWQKIEPDVMKVLEIVEPAQSAIVTPASVPVPDALS